MRTQTVMVVEDHTIVREYAALVLVEDLGLHVVEAADLEDARNALHTRPDIQLVVIDVAARKGYDRYAGVRLLASRWPHVSLIVTTGKSAP